MTGCAQLTVFRDPVDPGGNRGIVPIEIRDGLTVGDVVREAAAGAPYVRAYHNGRPADDAALVKRGDMLTVAAFPEDPISVGTAIVSLFTSIAPGAIGATYGSALLFSIGLLVDSAIMAGIGAAASLLIEEPKLPDRLESGTYNKAGMVTSRAEGAPIPVAFGRIKVPGHVIHQRFYHIGGGARNYGAYSASVGNLRTLTVIALSEGKIHSIGGQTSDLTMQWFSAETGQRTVHYGALRLPALKTDTWELVRSASTNQRVAFAIATSSQITGPVIASLVRLLLFRIGDLTGKKVRVTLQNGLGTPDGIDLFTPVEFDAMDLFRSSQDKPSEGYNAAIPAAFACPDVYIGPLNAGLWVVIDGDWTPSTSACVGIMTWGYNGSWCAYNGATWSVTSPTSPPYGPLANAEVIGDPTPWSGTEVNVNGNDLANFATNGHITTRLGSSAQEPVPGLSEVTRITPINVALPFGKPQVASTQEEVDGVSLLITFPQGWYSSKHNQPQGKASFNVDVRVRPTGQDKWAASFRHQAGIFSAAPGHNILIDIPFPVQSKTPWGQLNGQKVDIEMTAVPEPSVPTLAEWTLIQEIRDEQAQTCPFIALVSIDSDVTAQSGALQNFSAIVEGQEALVFDNGGTVRTWQYTTNPAWLCLKWLLSQRFGAGNRLTLGNIDIDSFEDWADFCDELVDDGTGRNTTCKRWEFGGNFDVERSHWEYAKYFAAASRTKLFRVGNVIRAKPEQAASSIVHLFTNGNIIEDTFEIEWFGTRKRPNHIYIDFLDEDLDFDWNSAPDHDETTERTGSVVEHREVIGITKMVRGRYLARYLTNLARSLTSAIKFEASVDAAPVEPGDVFAFQFDMIQPAAATGRVFEDAVGANAVKLDRPITVEAGKTYKISIRTAGSGQLTIQERTCTESPGTYPAGTLIDFTPSWDGGDYPKKDDPYSFGEESATAKHVELYEVITADLTRDGRKVIRAVNYDPAVFDIDLDPHPSHHQGPKPEPLTGASIPPAPRNLRLRKVVSRLSGKKGVGIEAVWEKAAWPWPYECIVWGRIDSLGQIPYHELGRVSGNTFHAENLLVGHTYTVAVTPMAVSTGQHHNPNSAHAARATLTLEWSAVKPPQLLWT